MVGAGWSTPGGSPSSVGESTFCCWEDVLFAGCEDAFAWEFADAFCCAEAPCGACSKEEEGSEEGGGEVAEFAAAFAAGSGGGGGGGWVEGCDGACVLFCACGCEGCCAEAFCTVPCALAFAAGGTIGCAGFVAFTYMYAPMRMSTMKRAAAMSFIGGCFGAAPNAGCGFICWSRACACWAGCCKGCAGVVVCCVGGCAACGVCIAACCMLGCCASDCVGAGCEAGEVCGDVFIEGCSVCDDVEVGSRLRGENIGAACAWACGLAACASSPSRCAADAADGFMACIAVGGLDEGEISKKAESTSDASQPTLRRSKRTCASVRPNPLHFFMYSMSDWSAILMPQNLTRQSIYAFLVRTHAASCA